MSGPQYTPLDPSQRNIRLVILLPGQWADVISCKLVIAALEVVPQYEALSYYWGNPKTTIPILVDECWCDVTNNLANALRRIRSQTTERTLWIDAICINQADSKEKTHQVGMMGDIYSKTSCCLVWLGEDKEDENAPFNSIHESAGVLWTFEDSEKIEMAQLASNGEAASAFRLLYSLAKCSNQGHVYNLPDDHGVMIESPWDKNTSPKWFDPACESLNTLIVSRQWWDRIWTLQEAVLPREMTFICGGMSMPWKMLSAAADALQRCRRCCESFLNGLDPHLSMTLWHLSLKCFRISSIRKGEQRRNIWSLLTIGLSRESTNPLDKVYGVLGLAQLWDGQDSIVADYSVAPRKLMERVSFEELRHSRALKALVSASHRPVANFELPSWVTDWTLSLPERQVMALSNWAVDYDDYSACDDTVSDVWLTKDGALSLWGIQVDIVEQVGLKLEVVTGAQWDTYSDTIRLWRRLLQSRRGEETPYSSSDGLTRAFIRAILGGRLVRRITTGISYQAERKLYQISEVEYAAYEKMIRNDSSGRHITSEMQNDVQRGVRGRHFFITRTGYVGFASGNVEISDEIYVFCGGRIPFVLRRQTNQSKPYFSLQGSGYVEGIMSGEVMERYEQRKEEVFLV